MKSGTVEVRLEDGEVRDVPAAEWTAEALDEHIALELIFAHYDDIGIDARAPQTTYASLRWAAAGHAESGAVVEGAASSAEQHAIESLQQRFAALERKVSEAAAAASAEGQAKDGGGGGGTEQEALSDAASAAAATSARPVSMAQAASESGGPLDSAEEEGGSAAAAAAAAAAVPAATASSPAGVSAGASASKSSEDAVDPFSDPFAAAGEEVASEGHQTLEADGADAAMPVPASPADEGVEPAPKGSELAAPAYPPPSPPPTAASTSAGARSPSSPASASASALPHGAHLYLCPLFGRKTNDGRSLASPLARLENVYRHACRMELQQRERIQCAAEKMYAKFKATRQSAKEVRLLYFHSII